MTRWKNEEFQKNTKQNKKIPNKKEFSLVFFVPNSLLRYCGYIFCWENKSWFIRIAIGLFCWKLEKVFFLFLSCALFYRLLNRILTFVWVELSYFSVVATLMTLKFSSRIWKCFLFSNASWNCRSSFIFHRENQFIAHSLHSSDVEWIVHLRKRTQNFKFFLIHCRYSLFIVQCSISCIFLDSSIIYVSKMSNVKISIVFRFLVIRDEIEWRAEISIKQIWFTFNAFSAHVEVHKNIFFMFHRDLHRNIIKLEIFSSA